MITEQMVDNFNEILHRFGSVIMLRLGTIGSSVAVYIDLINNRYIDSKIINVSDEFYEMLCSYFKSYGINLSCNNTRSIFWSKDPS